jgi:hypothetical protein
MTHRQECIAHCKDFLHSRNLSYVYDEKVFTYCYNKNNGSSSNAVVIGLKAADMMIVEFKPKGEEVYNDTTNE